MKIGINWERPHKKKRNIPESIDVFDDSGEMLCRIGFSNIHNGVFIDKGYIGADVTIMVSKLFGEPKELKTSYEFKREQRGI